jgi:hypothetical protein
MPSSDGPPRAEWRGHAAHPARVWRLRLALFGSSGPRANGDVSPSRVGGRSPRLRRRISKGRPTTSRCSKCYSGCRTTPYCRKQNLTRPHAPRVNNRCDEEYSETKRRALGHCAIPRRSCRSLCLRRTVSLCRWQTYFGHEAGNGGKQRGPLAMPPRRPPDATEVSLSAPGPGIYALSAGNVHAIHPRTPCAIRASLAIYSSPPVEYLFIIARRSTSRKLKAQSAFSQ